jgi:hypothetical protein
VLEYQDLEYQVPEYQDPEYQVPEYQNPEYAKPSKRSCTGTSSLRDFAEPADVAEIQNQLMTQGVAWDSRTKASETQ